MHTSREESFEDVPNEPFLFNILGITHAAKGLFAESLNYYEKAIDLNPSYFEVFNNMGVAYNDWKKPKEAISCLKESDRYSTKLC